MLSDILANNYVLLNLHSTIEIPLVCSAMNSTLNFAIQCPPTDVTRTIWYNMTTVLLKRAGAVARPGPASSAPCQRQPSMELSRTDQPFLAGSVRTEAAAMEARVLRELQQLTDSMNFLGSWQLLPRARAAPVFFLRCQHAICLQLPNTASDRGCKQQVFVLITGCAGCELDACGSCPC